MRKLWSSCVSMYWSCSRFCVIHTLRRPVLERIPKPSHAEANVLGNINRCILRISQLYHASCVPYHLSLFNDNDKNDEDNDDNDDDHENKNNNAIFDKDKYIKLHDKE